MNIYLVGFPACGKSCVGLALARKLKYRFVDLDREIEKKEKRNIAAIVAEKGWRYFRSRERKLLKSFSKSNEMVVALGGGITLSRNNGGYLLKKGICVFIKVPFNVLKKRIFRKRKKWPLFSKFEKSQDLSAFCKKLYTERERHYKKANIIVFVNALGEKETAEKILKKIRTKHEI